MKKHVIKICQTAYFELRRISSIRRFLTEDANKTLVASYILSRLDYCNCLLLGTANSVIQPLQKIQNFAARLVLLAPRHHHSTPLLEKLHWLPILERIKSKVACMCFSAMNGSGPAYLSELLHVYTPSRTLRSSSNTRMLEIQQCKRKIHGFHTFSCFGPVIWNSLPQDLRHCSTLSSFKAKLKTFLFSQYFHPNLYQYPVSATVSVCACVRACVRAWMNRISSSCNVYLTIVDETGSCRLLIMLGDGPRCKVLGDEFFSAYWSDATSWNISDTISLITIF